MVAPDGVIGGADTPVAVAIGTQKGSHLFAEAGHPEVMVSGVDNPIAVEITG
jgi:hypothetical protein